MCAGNLGCSEKRDVDNVSSGGLRLYISGMGCGRSTVPVSVFGDEVSSAASASCSPSSSTGSPASRFSVPASSSSSLYLLSSVAFARGEDEEDADMPSVV